jgi:predicted ATPase
VARDAEWRGVEVLWGERQETEPSVPYGLLVEALADGLSPLRASQLGWGRIKPLLIVLENLHWAGEDTLDVLSHLTPLLSERGVLVIGSYRGEDARALPGVWENLQALDRAGVQHRLSLSGLDGAATGELIRRSLGMGTPVPLFETRLYQETQGNPLFVLETLRALYGEGLLAQGPDGHWSTPWDETTSDYAELPLPRAVEQTIARRLAFLSSSLQQVIHLVAVLGERFDFDLLHAASHEESHILLTALRELVQRRFLDETAKDYRFSHDKIRQVAYDSIDARERSQLHLQIAQALEARLPDRVAALAHHWTESEVWDKAADYHQQAGDRARAVYANAEAAAHYTQALAALERLPEPPDPMPVFALRLAREAVYGLQGERAAQAEDLAVLEALAKRLDDARLDAGGRLPAARWRAEVALRQANYRWAISDYPTTIVAAQAAIDLAQTQQAVELEAAGYLHWGQALWSQGNYEAAETQLGQALALARDAKLNQVEADALRKLGLAYWHQGNNIQAKACFEQALRTHRDIGDRQGESEALNNLGLAAMHSGDYAEANTHLEQALHIHHEIGDWRGESVALNYLGLTATHLGNHAKARDYLRQSLRMGHKTGDRQVERKALTNLGKVSVTCGQYAEAKVCCQQVLRICREIGDQEGEGWGLIILSLLSHHLGDYKATQEYSQQALRIAQDLGAGHVQGGALTLLGHAFAGLGQLAEAADAYRQALILQRELGQHNEATESLAGLAHVALNRGDTAQAYDYIEELLKHLEMNTLHGAEEPFLVYLICCRVLQALQDPRASDILKSAHSLLQEEAAKIGDEELRRSFLENVKAHREIIAAYRDLEALQPGHRTQVRLPRADAPTGRALRDDEYTTITWTVDAPGDEEIPRKTDRRRYRILRLLAEAQAQDAVPRDQDLAAALGVSLPTLRRDMAVLRSEGHELPTRGRK